MNQDVIIFMCIFVVVIVVGGFVAAGAIRRTDKKEFAIMRLEADKQRFAQLMTIVEVFEKRHQETARQVHEILLMQQEKHIKDQSTDAT